MTPDISLVAWLTICGIALVLAVLALRTADQRGRDRRRLVITARMPRGLKTEQVQAVIRVCAGMTGTESGVAGRSSVALEVVGTAGTIAYRLRLPQAAASYLTAQLRAAVPGIGVDEVENFSPERCRRAVELGRQVSAVDLAVKDAAAVSRTILAALTRLRGGEVLVWQLVIAGGLNDRPVEPGLVQRVWRGRPAEADKPGAPMIPAALRIGAVAATDERARELVARLRRAAAAVGTPGARLRVRLLPAWVVRARLAGAATPVTTAAGPLRLEEATALAAWPIEGPLVPGLRLGGSPQIPVGSEVPLGPRVLGRATASERSVAQATPGAREHTLVLGPTGVGKTWLAVRMFVTDVALGRGGLFIDPKGGAADAVLARLDEDAIERTVVIDPTDVERPVPVPLLSHDGGGAAELAADMVVGLLRHRFRDLGPRSTDILTSSLQALGRTSTPSLMDLLRLWSDTGYRAQVAGLVRDDPVLSGFFAWFNGLGVAERTFMLAAPMNKIRPLLQRRHLRNLLAARQSTFSLSEALDKNLVIVVRLSEGELGREVVTLVGQVLLARLWAAVQGRRGRKLFPVTIDEAPRFLDQPTDLGEMLARSREYGVGLTLIGQTLAQLPEQLRDVALNSARTKIAFGTSARDARRLAEEFGPGVEADYFNGLARYEAIGAVSLGGAVSQPFTFRTEPLDEPVRGRAAAVRRASRERFGVPREEIEAEIKGTEGGGDATGPVGRRAK